MRQASEVAADLDDFSFESGHSSRLQDLADEIEHHPQAVDLIESTLRLFERFPTGDFGMPGPLAHAIERFYGRGYEAKLASSLARSPTSLTIWLANRIANAKDRNAAAFVAILREIAERTDIDSALAQDAGHFASLHVTE